MGRKRTSAGYSDGLRIPIFRRCWLGEDRIEVTPPLLFGSGFIFDRSRRVVTIRLCLFGRTLHKEELPFSDITIKLSSRERQATSPLPARYKEFFIEMIVADGTRLKVCDGEHTFTFSPHEETRRIENAIRKMGITG